MRLFLAQSAELEDYAALRERFAPCLEGRWRAETSLHATLLFLGERFAPRDIIETVEQSACTLEDAAIVGVSRFGHNRIFYAASDHPSLVEANATLSRAFGLTVPRRYVPHVTLMRFKAIDELCFEAACRALGDTVLGRIDGPLKLMQSTLTPEGAVYELVHQF